MKVTRKGRHKLIGPDGALVSEHTDPDEAFEKAAAHAATLPAGVHKYRFQPAEKEIEVSTLSRVVYDIDTTAPSAPVLNSVTSLSTSSLRVAWSASTDAGSGVSGYRVRRSTSSGGTYTQVGGDLSSLVLTYDDTGLSSSTTYFYRVTSFDAAGNESSSSNTGSGTTGSVGGLSAPNVAGSIATGNRVIATPLPGESFGSRNATILVYDDGRNGTSGASIAASGASGPRYGSWTQMVNGTGASGATYWDASQFRARGRSARRTVASDGYGNFARGSNLVHAATQEIYVSSWFRISLNTNQIQGGRLKPWWIMDSDGDLGTDGLYDLVIPTRGSNNWSFAGNSVTATDYDFNVGNICTANTWTRSAKWLKGNGGANCRLYYQTVSSVHGNVQQSATLSQSTFWQGLPEQITHTKFWPYASPQQPASGWQTYDSWESEPYVAIGEGACARVEIGNHVTYGSCTDLRLCYINSWSTGEIDFYVDPDFSLSGKYFHFIDATNTHTNGGTGRLIS